MEVRWDKEADAAYISLIPSKDRTVGMAYTSVPLDAEALDPDVPALNSLILDFDRDGRLIGIEVLGHPEAVLRDATLGRAS